LHGIDGPDAELLAGAYKIYCHWDRLSFSVVSDEVIQSEKFGSVQHVVHYNLPSRKEHFRQRLALLYSAIQE